MRRLIDDRREDLFRCCLAGKNTAFVEIASPKRAAIQPPISWQQNDRDVPLIATNAGMAQQVIPRDQLRRRCHTVERTLR
jgi:hypothetical protein